SKAVEGGLLNKNRDSYVISGPTGSGKTLVAELMSVKAILKDKKKALYLCPLRALATEQYQNFKEKYGPLGMKVALSIGDYDSKDKRLGNYDLIISSYEKADSLLRHDPDWLDSLELLVIDEIQNIDSNRGPTLEVLISRIKHLKPEVKILALSATMPNAEQISEWINAKTIKSDYRPVPLYEGVYHNGTIRFKGKENRVINKKRRELDSIILETLEKNEQSIVFANTRKNSESNAKRASKITEEKVKKYTPRQRQELIKTAQKIKNSLSRPTNQCKRLSKIVEKGSAFHHAGLVRKQRNAIEEAFKKGLVKIIVATPTLAAGINLPTKRVVMNSMYMYTGQGSQPIQVNRYKQRAGRAGRPQYDKYGEAIILARKREEIKEFKERYIEGELEPVESKLGSEPVLREHVLSSIVSFCKDTEDLQNFFSKTFYGKTYGTEKQLQGLLKNVVNNLDKWNFIDIEKRENSPDKLIPTPIGSRVSQLYIDPLSAHKINKALEYENEIGEIGYLFMISDTEEMRPYLRVKRREEPGLWSDARENEERIPKDLSGFDLSVSFPNKYKLTKLLQDWVNEKPEEELMRKYGILPGILRRYLKNGDWVVYSAEELSKITGNTEKLSGLMEIRKRIKYGVKKELIPLTDIKGIGRVRARRLSKKGIKKIEDIKEMSYQNLSNMLGPKTAKKTKERLGQEVNEDVDASDSTEEPISPAQKTISDY
ncbi:MAG: DEAD/DEAH box helicase, partial [archaeon]